MAEYGDVIYGARLAGRARRIGGKGEPGAYGNHSEAVRCLHVGLEVCYGREWRSLRSDQADGRSVCASSSDYKVACGPCGMIILVHNHRLPSSDFVSNHNNACMLVVQVVSRARLSGGCFPDVLP